MDGRPGLGAALRHWRSTSGEVKWLTVAMAAAYLLAARRSRGFCSCMAVVVLAFCTEVGWTISKSYKLINGTVVMKSGSSRALLGLYVAAAFLVLFRVTALRQRKASWLLLGVLLAVGVRSAIASNFVPGPPVWNTSVSSLLGQGFGIVLLMGGAWAVAAIGHRRQIRPTLRWSLLVAPAIGAMVSGGPWGALYAAIVAVTLLGVWTNPRPMAILTLVPWVLVVAPSAIFQLMIRSTRSQVLNSTAMFAAGLITLACVARSVQRLHRSP